MWRASPQEPVRPDWTEGVRVIGRTRKLEMVFATPGRWSPDNSYRQLDTVQKLYRAMSVWDKNFGSSSSTPHCCAM